MSAADYRGFATEKQFSQGVVNLAKLTGWLVYRTWRSDHSPAGFPDLVLVHPERRRVVFAELKTDRGKVSAEQWGWIVALNKAGCDAWVWRPREWDRIEAVLKGEVGP